MLPLIVYFNETHMRKYFLFLIILSGSLLMNCHANDTNLKSKPTDNITIVFKKNPLANSSQQNQFYTKNFVRYFNGNFIAIQKELENKLSDDTVKITTSDEFFPVALFHNYIYLNYLFKNGDTVVFDFDKEDIPNPTILNRKVSKWESNFPILIKKRFNQLLKGANTIGPPPKSSPTVAMRFEGWYADFNNQNRLIDSLLEKGIISTQSANYHNDEVKANLYRNIGFKELRQYLLKKVDIDTVISFANRSDLLQVSFFQDFLVYSYLPSDILGIEKISLSQSRTLNYMQAYDKVNTHFTSPVVREYLLFYCVNKIKEESTKANYNTYLAKFKAINKNKAYLDILKSDEINNNVAMGNNSIAIADVNGKQTDWNGFIKAAKGKIVYVDLWASWCAPCRAAMPASKKLKTSYVNKPIVFTYLSLDIKKADWLKAAEEENIKFDKNSFLLIDPKNSVLTKKLNLATIPRYLIYNKKGELVNANAPGPDSPKLKDLIDQYLTEN